jgi:hypothetical protein
MRLLLPSVIGGLALIVFAPVSIGNWFEPVCHVKLSSAHPCSRETVTAC